MYVGLLVLLALGLRYRDTAQKWLDRQFFRSDYDAKEILLSLASRVPQETDPRALLSLVLTDIESALHPASIAVLAESGGAYEVAEARHQVPSPVAASSGLVQLLQWSDAPLEVFLSDSRSTVGRLPAADRDWLAASGAALVVPVLAGSSVDRPLVGFVVLGPKRSEESYTSEDRRLLAGIAAQMGLALDLSRLRRQAAATPGGAAVSPAGTDRTGGADRYRCHDRRQVPNRRAGRPRRHGRGVSRPRHAPGAGCRGEGGAGRTGVVGHGSGTLQA